MISSRCSQAFRLFIIVLVLLVVLTSTSYADGEVITDKKQTFPSDPSLSSLPTNQLIIQYQNGETRAPIQPSGEAQLARLSSAAGTELSYVREMSGDAHVLRLPALLPVEQVEALAQRLAELPEVALARPDYVRRHTLVPNDTYYGTDQWDFRAPAANNYGINAPAAWDITTGSATVVAAVIDTGILNHADLSGRTVPGYDFVQDVMVANDGDGRDNNPADPGDWVSPEDAGGYFKPWHCDVSDSSWHGTHVAGTIGAIGNNNMGVAGINWTSKILPVRVLGKCVGFDSDIIDGIRWAAGVPVTGVPANGNPAKVLNISLGGPSPCDSFLQSAINDVLATGATVVVAAGNSSTNAGYFAPANCSGVITVAATNRDGWLADYSNYGSAVEISAPGGETFFDYTGGILSTLNFGKTSPANDAYAFYQGTSMAAPHVTGIVSLLYSRNQALTSTQVLSILQNTATQFPTFSSCSTSQCGKGIINAGAAVASVLAPDSFSKLAPINQATGTPTSLALSWASTAGATSYEVCYDTTNNATCNSNWVSTGTSTTLALTNLPTGTTHYWQVRAKNQAWTVDANNGAWWSFTTLVLPPGAFNKTGPGNGASAQPTDLTLTWGASSGAAGYEVCYDTTANDTCDSSWLNAGTTPTAALSNLTPATTYYWQVRAVNTGGTTYANNSTWWSFTTRTPVVGEFNKLNPARKEGMVPTSVTLIWGVSSLATGYEYCYDTSANNLCDSSWVSTGTTNNANLTNLAHGQTYSWHVRAVTGGDPIYSNDNVWWTFTTQPAAPGAFSKNSPANNSPSQATSLNLTWSASSNAASYEYCFDTSNNDSCDDYWYSNGALTNANIGGLAVGKTYYWQVRATNLVGNTSANNNAWWSFTVDHPASSIDFKVYIPLLNRE